MGSFLDGFGEIIKNGADAYGNILQARAQADAARIQAYGGHGGGTYGVNGFGQPEYGIDAAPVSATLPAWVLVAGAAALVFVLARR